MNFKSIFLLTSVVERNNMVIHLVEQFVQLYPVFGRSVASVAMAINDCHFIFHPLVIHLVAVTGGQPVVGYCL